MGLSCYGTEWNTSCSCSLPEKPGEDCRASSFHSESRKVIFFSSERIDLLWVIKLGSTGPAQKTQKCQVAVLRKKQLPACSAHGLLLFMLMWHKWEKGGCVLTWAPPFWTAGLDLPFSPNLIKFWNAQWRLPSLLCPLMIPCNNHPLSILLSCIHHRCVRPYNNKHPHSYPYAVPDSQMIVNSSEPTSCLPSHLREKGKQCQCWTLENPSKILSYLSQFPTNSQLFLSSQSHTAHNT